MAEDISIQSHWPTVGKLDDSCDFDLPADALHVWRVDLDIDNAMANRLFRLLSPNERERAERFRFAVHRCRFIAGRGTLRLLLGQYLGAGTAEIRFAYDGLGKPRLAEPYEQSGVQFNVSHSDRLAIIGVTRGRRIGVDVERLREDVACEELAERFFSQAEAAALRAVSAKERSEAFFRCWTRKEAYLKATGHGLSRELNRFDVSLLPYQPPALLRVEWDGQEPARWAMWELAPAAGFLGAAMVERPCQPPRCRRWNAV